MISTKLMLQELLQWTQQQQKPIEQYIRDYPYPKYEAVSATNILRHRITNILHHIITVVATPHPHAGGLNREESCNVNVLCGIKSRLDQLRIVFLTVHTIKTTSFGKIIAEVESLIRMADVGELLRQKVSSINMPRNRSFDQEKYSTCQQKPNYVDRNHLFGDKSGEKGHRGSRQKERTVNIKGELYEQMIRDLTRRQKINMEKIEELDRFEERRKRIVSDYEQARNNLPPKYTPRVPKNILAGAQIHEQQQAPKQPAKERKRIFKYLEEDKKRSINHKEKYNNLEAHNYTYESPHTNKFKTLPDTQPHSNHSENYELPELHIDEEKLQELKKKLDWKISKIKKVDQREQEDWQLFEGDSGDAAVVADLDDSLQLMKQQQALNKTGCFNPILLSNQEDHEYSFSHD